MTSTPALIERFGPFVVVNADRSPHAEPAALILAGIGEVGELVDVLDRDEASQFIVFVNQQQFLDFIFRQNPFSRFKRCIFRGRDQVVLGHDLGEPLVVVRQEPQIAAGEDPLQIAVDRDRHAADVLLFHDAQGRARPFR